MVDHYEDATRAICEALGLNPHQIHSLAFTIGPGGVTKVSAELVAKGDALQDVAKVLKTFVLVPPDAKVW